MEVPDSLARRIELFRRRGRIFRHEDELFAEASWLAVLLGQEVTPGGYDPLADIEPLEEVERAFAQIHGLVRAAADGMPPHEAFVAGYCPAPAPQQLRTA